MNKLNPLTLSWLKNGILALAIAGAYSIILVMLRTPGINGLFADKDIFRSALVIHVNLSVLVWLLSIIGIIWSHSLFKTGLEILFSRLSLAGMIIMAISPLVGKKVPVMNNYIPMLENAGFIIGLSLFGVAMLLASVAALISTISEVRSNNFKMEIVSLVKLSSALLYQMVWICFVLSFLQLDRLTDIVPVDIDFYYELLYWSGGHLLQFLYTQALMFVWYFLFEIWIGKLKFNFLYKSLLILNFILGSLLFYGHYAYQITDGEFKNFFTLHMIFAAGIAPGLFIIALFYEAARERFTNRIREAPRFIPASIFCSSLLFLSGGLIGAVISGVNVTIPAHYHGSIVGISIAFMGLAYVYCYRAHLLQESGNTGTAASPGAAKVQIYVITTGQILHIAGLAMAGGYGVLRKTPGEEIALSARVYMGMVGIGGLIAIIGGLMFVYICAKRLYSS